MKPMKFLYIFAVLSFSAAWAQSPLSISKIKEDSRLKIFEYNKINTIAGVISEIPYTFHIKYDNNSLLISFVTTSSKNELWTEKKQKLPKEQYIHYLMNECATLLKLLHISPEFQKCLNAKISQKDYEFNFETGRLLVFGDMGKYEESSLEVLHTAEFSYVYNITIIW